MPTPLARRSSHLAVTVLLGAAAALTACSSGGGQAGGGGPSASLKVSRSGAVTLPAGVAVSTSELTVRSASAQVSVAPDGSFKLGAFDAGANLAMVNGPGGDPLLLGWLDGTRAHVDARTTAEVLLHFAAGVPWLPEEDHGRAVALVAEVPGLDALATAIEAALAADPHALAAPNAGVKAALDAILADLRSTPAAAAVRPTPPVAVAAATAGGTRSGLTVHPDLPFEAHITNDLRRRAWAFVERVSYVNAAGVVVADPAAVSDFEVPPVIGVNGGVTGAFSDIFNAYYGNQPTAYGPIDTPRFAVPLVEGSRKTTYRIRVVGPALLGGVEASLTGAQSSKLFQVSVRAFLQDLVVPYLVNVVLGSGAADFTRGQATPLGRMGAEFLAGFASDFVTIALQVPGLDEQIAQGHWDEALATLWGDAAASATMQTRFKYWFEAAARTYYTDLELDPGKLSGAFESFNRITGAAGGILQAWDTGAYELAMAGSERAVEFTLDVVEPRLAILPEQSQVGRSSHVDLVVTVPGSDDASGYSYHWKNSGDAGTLMENGPAGRISNDFCSSAAAATYLQLGDPEYTTVDRVTVDVHATGSCAGTPIGTATASVTYRVAWVEGVVSGQTHDGVTVTASGPGSVSDTTNYWGEYFLKLGDGTWTITPSQEGFTFYPASRTVVVSGSDVPHVDFTSANCSGAGTPIHSGCGSSTQVSPAVAAPGDTVTITFTQRSGALCGGDTSVWMNVPGEFLTYPGGTLANGRVTYPGLPTDPSSAARSLTFRLSPDGPAWNGVIRCPRGLGYYEPPSATTGPYATVTTGAWHDYVPFTVSD